MIATNDSSPLRLAVLNPGGSDPDQEFPDFAGAPGGKGHPPVNYHAYAACTAGSFHRNVRTVPAGRPVLLVLRRNLQLCLGALSRLQAKGSTVAVSLKESGTHQSAAFLADPGRLLAFREICARADFCLSSTPDLVPFYLDAGAMRAEFVPTPYPVSDLRWDFSRSGEPAATMGDRRGVFIGTREFDVPSRNHLAALWAARRLGERVTVVNLDGWRGRRLLKAVGFDAPRRDSTEPAPELRIIDGRMDYRRYLQLMATHRIVFQLDRSAVPGQVAGDALLCRVPCVGGDGVIERTAFPSLCGYRRESEELVETASFLLRDDGAYAEAIEESQRMAREHLAFPMIASRLKAVFSAG